MSTLEEARRIAAGHLDAARYDLGRPFGRPPRPGIWLLLLAVAALGFRTAEAVAGRSRDARRTG